MVRAVQAAVLLLSAVGAAGFVGTGLVVPGPLPRGPEAGCSERRALCVGLAPAVRIPLAMTRKGTDSNFDELQTQIMRQRLEENWLKARLKARPVHLPFEEAVKWVRAMGRWDSKEEWFDWISDGEKRNAYIPNNPEEYYGE
eukprot:CAMPEP_0206241210 /NCGR_PEP_ID=MMETSP0047_2-20121206/16372_1 /ASSEMBLY_ACC=CAM_ASM_000192 /TAXON_ID=195065 /ORGANISM="Chroomonas mesostigmatica_cf, Strain CCMP1168" /LENGTH=141 /DNA_ID=CAMNT_0053666087 /DNA_START=9 /DNA_END=431 /DNA_ORIENTATION=+